MKIALQTALHEYNRRLPAWKPFYRFEELSPADQSRVELRAEEIWKDMVLTLCAT